MILYALADMEKACADLLDEDRLQVGKSGTVKADGEVWGTVGAFAKKLVVSDGAIASRLDSSCRSRPGKDSTGKPVTLYALSDVKKACAELLDKSRLLTGKDGMVKADGEAWGTAEALVRKLKLSRTAIVARLDSCRSRPGKNSMGKPAILYALSDVKRACATLLDKTLLQVGKDGTAKADGETWGTLKVFARMLGVSKDAMKYRLDSCRSRSGKNQSGRAVTLYALSDVKEACKDLLDKKRGK